MEEQIVVIGAGPAGLTAALELSRADVPVTVLESDGTVGGISRTVERDGWRFDIGGHRFFTKVPEVEAVWHELLGEELLYRSRQSRIWYREKFYDYPLRLGNALHNLGFVESLRCVLSYLWAKVRPRDRSTFEGWVASRFGWRLYQHFFKTYTEKVWGVDATELSADWAAQRIQALSLWRVAWEALKPERPGQDVPTSLIEAFHYPKLGPGMMWERCRDRVEEAGNKVLLHQQVTRVEHHAGRVVAVEAQVDGVGTRYPCQHVVSSMPLAHLVRALDPPAPAEVLAAADGLRFRDFLSVALVVPEEAGFPDNWVYVHSPEVQVGRIQNFGAWSPYMVRDAGYTCLGLEYFAFEGDGLWTMDDDELVRLAEREIGQLGLVDPSVVETGYVVRMPRAYPVYDHAYADNVARIRDWLDTELPTVHPVGRNGMHRYNNQDHSMLTAMRSVENILHGAGHDVWAVNVGDEYHEAGTTPDTGRAAPISA